MSKPQFIYVTYIATTPEKLWQALTDSDLTAIYWGHRNVSDWQPGSRWEHQRVNGSGVVDIVGSVLENEPPKRLVLSWASPENEGDAGKTSRVSFDIQTVETQVCLTVTHEELEPGSQMLSGVTRGWPIVLSSLKTYLETGKSLVQWGDGCKNTATKSADAVA